MIDERDIYDVTIIGGGPAGLFTAFYSGLREMKTKIIEYLPFLGGKVAYFYPEKIIRDIGGIAHRSGDDVTAELIEQAQTFDPTVVLNEEVVKISRVEEGLFCLESRAGQKHYSKTIVLATGFGILKTKKLDLTEAAYYEGKGLYYTVQHMEGYRDKTVLVCGGGNSAVDWALELEPIAKKVYLVHRRDGFKALESNVTKLKNSQVEVLTPYQLVGLVGEAGELSSVQLRHAETHLDRAVSIDALIVNHGFEINMMDLSENDIAMDAGMIAVDSKMETTVPGIFAIGDISNYPDKLGLIAGAFNEGPIAVNHAKKLVDPKNDVPKLFSTAMDVFE